MEHPRQCCHHLPSRGHPAFPYQYRVHYRPQRLVRSKRRQWPVFIHHWYRLSCKEASQWRSAASTTMVTGPLWTDHQHCESLLPFGVSGLGLLSARHSCGTNKYELWLLDIWICHHLLHDLLHLDRKESLHSTCGQGTQVLAVRVGRT